MMNRLQLPVSHALQKHDDMKNLYQEIHYRLAAKGEPIQLFGRLGCGPHVPLSQVEKKLI